ncbi:hypothetical protein B566_EDAN009927 [Ephemera danica]|nr:hypothetical protein B566_EDAN009927 [Ephemera danica]
MPILRAILRYLGNSEELVYKLSESKPVRRAAQLTVSLFHRSKLRTMEFEKSPAGRRMVKYLERLADRLKAIEDSQKSQKH